jgi:hypothetical protein
MGKTMKDVSRFGAFPAYHLAGALAVFALGGCTANVSGDPVDGPQGSGAQGQGGSGSTTGGTTGNTGGAGPGTGGAGASPATGGAGGGMATGGTGNVSGLGGTGVGGSAATGGTTIQPLCTDQATIQPGAAPLRRLTKFEYNNTVRDLLGDTTGPANAFPSELAGNGFANDALQQPVASLLAQGYLAAAENLAAAATASPAALGALAPCGSTVSTATEAACGRTIIDTFVPKAYRRPITTVEGDEYQALFDTVRMANGFASGVGAVIEAVLQSPDFLYRVEFGVADTVNPALKRPTGPEMATRLSYLFLGTQPDAALNAAAASGELLTNAGVLAQAQRLVGQAGARSVVTYFFRNLLPYYAETSGITRDPALFPTYTSAIGGLMRQETSTFLEKEVFEGPGTWTGILTAPYTYVNQALATYYGIPGVTGDTFQKVNTDPTQRLGLLTQGSIMVGTTVTDVTNPVRRGGFIVNHLMCRGIELPMDPAILEQVKPPDPYSAPTGRERYTLHKQDPVCAGCHAQLDPLGFSLENYDAVGLFRTHEVDVHPDGPRWPPALIDASGEVPDMPNGAVSGPIELAQKLAANEEVQNCFAAKWLDYGYGQRLAAHEKPVAEIAADQCTREQLAAAFRASGFNVKQLIVDLTQTDGFLYLGAQE